ENWKPQMEYFRKKGHRVLAYDLDGNGKSTGNGNLSLENHVLGLKKILEKRGIEKAVFIGHSDGGVIAQTFTAQNPERVLGLFLVNSYRRIPEDTRLLVRTLSEIYKKGKSVRGFLPRMQWALFKLKVAWQLGESRVDPSGIFKLFLSSRKPRPLEVLQNQSMIFNEVTAPYMEEQPPMRVIHTEGDLFLGRHGADQFTEDYGIIPTVLPLATHSPHQLWPARITREINDFLQKEAPSACELTGARRL
ncbi:MAG TPA: alpha/beta hydrolase, partial [Candidatus Norongarragalinales archaeon]|nr:alpha/beta hydrolase [Candidatus Norongarragalinales archaeon]